MNMFEVIVPLKAHLPGPAGPIIALRVRPVDPSHRKRRPRDVEESLWTASQYTGVHHSIIKHLSEPDFVALVGAIEELGARIDRMIAMIEGDPGSALEPLSNVGEFR